MQRGAEPVGVGAIPVGLTSDERAVSLDTPAQRVERVSTGRVIVDMQLEVHATFDKQPAEVGSALEQLTFDKRRQRQAQHLEQIEEPAELG